MPRTVCSATRVTRSTLASTLADQGKFDEAVQAARAAVTETRQRADTGAGLGFSLTVLGGFLADQENFAEADAALGEADTILRKLLQPSHLWLGDNLRNQAISLYRQAKFDEAQKRVSEAGRYISKASEPTMITIQPF